MNKDNKEKKESWDEVLMKIQEGDTLTSKKGFLSKSPITDEWFVYTRVKYNGNGCFVILSDKRVIEINVKNKKGVGKNVSKK